MTVKDIFDLRRQGRIEEAYDAIRPMYAAHRGRYTTLCMFWTAADIFKLRLGQGRTDEAAKILEALKRILPRVEEISKDLDREKGTSTAVNPQEKLPWEQADQQPSDSAAAFIASASRRLAKATPKSAVITNSTDDNVLSDTFVDKDEGFTLLTSSTDEKKDTPNTLPASSCSNPEPSAGEDLSHHLTVSLDDGIIRPIESVTTPQRVILACLVAHPGYSVEQISASTGLPDNSVEHHLSALIDRHLIEYRGSNENGGYYAL